MTDPFILSVSLSHFLFQAIVHKLPPKTLDTKTLPPLACRLHVSHRLTRTNFFIHSTTRAARHAAGVIVRRRQVAHILGECGFRGGARLYRLLFPVGPFGVGDRPAVHLVKVELVFCIFRVSSQYERASIPFCLLCKLGALVSKYDHCVHGRFALTSRPPSHAHERACPRAYVPLKLVLFPLRRMCSILTRPYSSRTSQYCPMTDPRAATLRPYRPCCGPSRAKPATRTSSRSSEGAAAHVWHGFFFRLCCARMG